MGVNFVVILENSRHISIQKFKEVLIKDPVVGFHAWSDFPEDEESPCKCHPWEEFEWENKRYFTWNFAPRLSTFNFYEFDANVDEPDACMITFLKIMLLAEQAAGGPVHISNDVVQLSHPDEAEDSRMTFYIPGELDEWVENWREIAQLDARPMLIH